jgi:hypothetical protein
VSIGGGTHWLQVHVRAQATRSELLRHGPQPQTTPRQHHQPRFQRGCSDTRSGGSRRRRWRGGVLEQRQDLIPAAPGSVAARCMREGVSPAPPPPHTNTHPGPHPPPGL